MKPTKGLCSIHLRITINRKSKYFKIEIPKKVSHKDWSTIEEGWVKSSHPFYFEINSKIIEKKSIINNLIKRSYSFNKVVSFEIIFQHLKRKGDINSFYDFISKLKKNLSQRNLVIKGLNHKLNAIV
jgi:Arm DNA-binding domain